MQCIHAQQLLMLLLVMQSQYQQIGEVTRTIGFEEPVEFCVHVAAVPGDLVCTRPRKQAAFSARVA